MMNVDGDMIYKILSFILMSRVTINHVALDLTIQGPPPLRAMGPHCTWTHSSPIPSYMMKLVQLGSHCAGTLAMALASPPLLPTLPGHVQTCSL